MKRLLLTILFAMITCLFSSASADSVSRVTLGLCGGVGHGLYRDLGASPLTYRGLELHPGISMTVEKGCCRREAFLLASGGAYGLKWGWPYVHAYGGHPILGYRSWRCLYNDGPWQMWAGGSLDNLFDIRYNSALGNASMGFGSFVRLNMEISVEYSLKRWLFHSQILLTPLALAMRPGYAYMDNFDQDISNPTTNTFDQYGWYVAAVPSCETVIGADLRMRNGNWVGLSYRWRFLTSRVSADGVTAPHRFDYAGHALVVALGFRLR